MPYIYTLLLALSSLFIHDYHFGYTEINYNKEQKSIETSIKLFTDDLEKALYDIDSNKVNLNTKEEIEISEEIIQQYVSKNFTIRVNNQDKIATYIGREYDENVTWIYLEYLNIKKIREFEVTNSLLLESFDDQKNIFSIKIKDNNYSPILEKGNISFKTQL